MKGYLKKAKERMKKKMYNSYNETDIFYMWVVMEMILQIPL